MENIFFKDILDLVPEPAMSWWAGLDGITISYKDWPGRETVRRAEGGIRAETIRFRAYLMEQQVNDRQIVAEYVTEDLINAYYSVRSAMNELSNKERDMIRPTMNALYKTIVHVTLCVQGDLKMRYSKSIAGSGKMEINNPLGDCFFDDEDDDPVKNTEISPISKEVAVFFGVDKTEESGQIEALTDGRIVAIISKAVDLGLVGHENGKYKWNGTKQMLAYLAVKASENFRLGKNRSGCTTTNWRIFEVAFGVKNLKGAKNDYMKIFTSFQPNGYDQVDKLFD